MELKWNTIVYHRATITEHLERRKGQLLKQVFLMYELIKRFMSQNTSPLKVDVYYDFSCPWCYVGFLRCQEVLEE